jgi:hypothetical protein
MTSRALVVIVTLTVLACTVLAVAEERRIEERTAVNDARVAELQAQRALLVAAPALEARRAQLRAHVDRDGGSPDRALRVVRFLRDAARCAASRHIVFASIAADGARGERRAASSDSAFAVSLEGGYRDVLATIRELSTQSVPASIDVGSLVRTNPEAPNPRLAATLRIVLENAAPSVPNDVRTGPV